MKGQAWGLVIILLVALGWCAWLIVQAHECGAAGGAYIIPQQGFPVCVAGVVP